jgi:hypothetical protein
MYMQCTDTVPVTQFYSWSYVDDLVNTGSSLAIVEEFKK